MYQIWSEFCYTTVNWNGVFILPKFQRSPLTPNPDGTIYLMSYNYSCLPRLLTPGTSTFIKQRKRFISPVVLTNPIIKLKLGIMQWTTQLFATSSVEWMWHLSTSDLHQHSPISTSNCSCYQHILIDGWSARYHCWLRASQLLHWQQLSIECRMPCRMLADLVIHECTV